MANIHEDLPSSQRHNPKDFEDAAVNEVLLSDHKGNLDYQFQRMLPSCLQSVSGHSAPPTENDGDIYLIREGTATVNGWDQAEVNDWVKYDSSADTWYGVTPVIGATVFDEDLDDKWSFDGTAWLSEKVGKREHFINITDLAFTTDSTYAGATLGADSAGNFTIFIPDDLLEIISVDLIVIPDGTESNVTINLSSNYAAVGEGKTENSENGGVEPSFQVDQLQSIDLSGVLSGAEAGDYAGITVTNMSVTTGFTVLGIKIKYK